MCSVLTVDLHSYQLIWLVNQRYDNNVVTGLRQWCHVTDSLLSFQQFGCVTLIACWTAFITHSGSSSPGEAWCLFWRSESAGPSVQFGMDQSNSAPGVQCSVWGSCGEVWGARSGWNFQVMFLRINSIRTPAFSMSVPSIFLKTHQAIWILLTVDY